PAALPTSSVRAALADDGGQRRAGLAAEDAKGREAQPLHSPGHDNAAVGGGADGDDLADPAAPFAGTAAVGTNVILGHDQGAVALDRFQRVVAHVVQRIVAGVDT